MTRKQLASCICTLALLAAAGSLPCWADAQPPPATLLFLAGPVTAFSKNSGAELLARGNAWREGVVLRTGNGGRAQAQFTDGTAVSLSPGSDVRLDAYRYDGAAGAQDSAAFTVYRGSVRFLAGTRRTAGSTLRIATPCAALSTAGGELLVEAAGGSIQVSVGNGQLELRNDGGRLLAGAGQRIFVKDRATAPILIGTIVPAPISPAVR